ERATPFDEDVIAYPCITTISNRKAENTQVCIDNSRSINFSSLTFKTVKSPKNSDWQTLFINYDLTHNSLSGIVEQGFKIGIGVATGLDKVFICKGSELHGIESTRLLPLIKSSDLRNNRFCWQNHFIINPYEHGELCNLDKYPFLKAYLLKNKQALLKRHTTKQNPEKRSEEHT